MQLEFRVIDAFAERPFSGNPAAVVILDGWTTENWPDNQWLQSIALEMNLSETAFLVSHAGSYGLRWFTPDIEVDLCGHATLAAAVALADAGRMPDGETIAFSTRSGQLSVSRRGDQYLLDFPVVVAKPEPAPPELLPALGVASALAVSKNRFDYLVELETEAQVKSLAPNITLLASIMCRGIIVTAVSQDDRFDFVSRFFAPAAGINEDPVTGSAHCSLVEYWSRRLGKESLVGHQISARGGVVGMQLIGDRVVLSGRGRLFSRGYFVDAIAPKPFG